MTKRICLEPLETAGIEMRRDDQVLLCIGAANHDPTIFPEPEKLDLNRPNGHQHIAFGYGLHSCLGAFLAQLQLDAYLGEIVSRKLTFELAGEVEWIDHSLILRGPKRLTILVSCNAGIGGAAGIPRAQEPVCGILPH